MPSPLAAEYPSQSKSEMGAVADSVVATNFLSPCQFSCLLFRTRCVGSSPAVQGVPPFQIRQDVEENNIASNFDQRAGRGPRRSQSPVAASDEMEKL